MHDLIIIGGGPAGVSAGIYAVRQNIKTLLITKSFGGQMVRKTVEIENYPGFEKISGMELISRFEKQLRGQNIEIILDEAVSLKKTGEEFFVLTKEKKQFSAKTVIVATGADPRPLEVLGEKEFIGRGVSYCTLCDGPVFSGKTIAVIGGGNSAAEAAIFMSGYAKKVYIMERGLHLRCDQIFHQRISKLENVETIVNVGLKEIKGNQFVSAIDYEDLETKEQKTLEVQGVFVEIGLQPATSFLKGQVNFNDRDEIIVNLKNSETNIPGLFTAGDVDDIPYKQIIIAAGEGAKAALSVYEYLKRKG